MDRELVKDNIIGFIPNHWNIEMEYGYTFTEDVLFKKTHVDAKLPEKQHKFDACWDLYSVEELIMEPMEVHAFDTGLQMQLPRFLEATIRPRSGLALKKQITVLNAPGTIDSTYRGNIKVILINLSKTTQVIKKGERIAQMQFGLTQKVGFKEVEELDDTERGQGGFGSTGTH